MARVKRRASQEWLWMISTGSTTLPRDLLILRPCSSLTCRIPVIDLRLHLNSSQLTQSQLTQCQSGCKWLPGRQAVTSATRCHEDVKKRLKLSSMGKQLCSRAGSDADTNKPGLGCGLSDDVEDQSISGTLRCITDEVTSHGLELPCARVTVAISSKRMLPTLEC